MTLHKAPHAPAFSCIAGDYPQIQSQLLPIGKEIENEIWALPTIDPVVKCYQYAVMPDHVHLLLFVTDKSALSLGQYISRFKVRVFRNLSAKGLVKDSVFAPDFHDRFLRPEHKLQTIIDYIRDNPRRLAVRYVRPDYFRRINALKINGLSWHGYGNMELLNNPFKEQVVVHRSENEAQREVNRHRWLHVASNGGVLVSPFISQAEKDVRNAAENAGGKFIIFTNNAMGERFKPAAHDFALCEQGRLLVLAPTEDMPGSRDTFLWLNSQAEALCLNGETFNGGEPGTSAGSVKQISALAQSASAQNGEVWG